MEEEEDDTNELFFILEENLLMKPIHFGIMLSTISYYVFFAVLLLSKKFHNLPGRNLMSWCVSWIILYTMYFHLCSTMECWNFDYFTASALYFFMTTMTWSLVISYDTWRTLRISCSKCIVSTGNRWKRFCAYSIFAWLVPLILILHEYLNLELEDDYFLFSIKSADSLLDFRQYGPIILIVSNSIFATISLFYIFRNKYLTRNMQQSCASKGFIGHFILPMKLLLTSGLIPLAMMICQIYQWTYCRIVTIFFLAYQGLIISPLFLSRAEVFRSIEPSNRIKIKF